MAVLMTRFTQTLWIAALLVDVGECVRAATRDGPDKHSA